MTDLPLIEYVAKTGKPMIVSTGMASAQEIHEAVECIKACGNEQLVLLHDIKRGEPIDQSVLEKIVEKWGQRRDSDPG